MSCVDQPVVSQYTDWSVPARPVLHELIQIFVQWLATGVWPMDVIFKYPSRPGGNIIKSVMRLITLSAHCLYWALITTGWRTGCLSCHGNRRTVPSYVQELGLYACWASYKLTSLHNRVGLRNSLKQAGELIKTGQYDILRSNTRNAWYVFGLI